MLPTIFSLAEYGSAGERSRRANKRNIGRYIMSQFTAKTRHYTHSCTPHNFQGNLLACSRAKQCLGPYRINNLKIGLLIQLTKLNIAVKSEHDLMVRSITISQATSLACMQTFKTHTNHFLGIPIILLLIFPFHLVNINASCFPLLFGTYG